MAGQLTPPFYGWYIVAVVFYATFLGIGGTIDAFAVLVKPMTEGLSWSRTQMMGAFTLAGLSSALAAPFAGRIVDRYGARFLMPAGALIAGLLLMSVSRINHLWQFYILFGIAIGLIRPAYAFVSATTTVSNWFIAKRGRAMAFTTMGAGISALTITSLTQWVITNFDWRTVWVMLGVMTCTLAIPAFLIIRRRPEDMGLLPDGLSDIQNRDAKEAPDFQEVSDYKIENDWLFQDAIRTRTFWLLVVSAILTSFPLVGAWLHASASFTDHGLSPAKAAMAMGSVAFASIPSRIFWGMVVEKLHIRKCMIITSIGLASSVLFIMMADSFGTAVFSMMLYGFFAGGTVVYDAMVWSEFFGRLELGSIQGFAEMFRIAGYAGGPLIAAIIYDTTGSYYIAFSAFFVGCIFASWLIYLARPPAMPTASHPAS